ncbi:hypothetical protein Bbelb_191100 [Branchiostoma belcheri]|nr:hypothetical protein Bbelb_191100 [Branchiostoma belcheri]
MLRHGSGYPNCIQNCTCAKSTFLDTLRRSRAVPDTIPNPHVKARFWISQVHPELYLCQIYFLGYEVHVPSACDVLRRTDVTASGERDVTYVGVGRSSSAVT